VKIYSTANNVLSFLKRRFRKFKFTKEYLFLEKKTLGSLVGKNLNDIYRYLFLYFHKYLSKELKRHRGYFFSEFRGFGEDAFHSLWFLLFNEYKPKNVLEIGIYRGQTLSLFHLLSRNLNTSSYIAGISPLDSSGDEFSEYLEINYEEDVTKNFSFFGLSEPNILKTYSTSPEGVNFINSKLWDLVYIDGSHRYEDVVSDLKHSISNLSPSGLIVIDDSSLYLDYSSDYIEDKFNIKSSKGHKDPSRAMVEMLEKNNGIQILITVGHVNVLNFK
jgi:hypothetical protein|tara:strand:- start:4386 stop:5207 length:822 start_codon:yes stop_codon:yes gene_type:complete